MHKFVRHAAPLAALLLMAQGAMAQVQSSSGAFSSSAGPQTVPEPSSLPLVLLALVGAVAVARFIKRK